LEDKREEVDAFRERPRAGDVDGEVRAEEEGGALDNLFEGLDGRVPLARALDQGKVGVSGEAEPEDKIGEQGAKASLSSSA
jgi:hypothetical protein